MAVSPAQMGQLAQLLTQTVAGNMQAVYHDVDMARFAVLMF